MISMADAFDDITVWYFLFEVPCLFFDGVFVFPRSRIDFPKISATKTCPHLRILNGLFDSLCTFHKAESSIFGFLDKWPSWKCKLAHTKVLLVLWESKFFFPEKLCCRYKYFKWHRV